MKLQKILFALTATLFAHSAMACESGHDVHIAFVDGAAVMEKYEPAIEARLQTELEDEQEALVALQTILMEESETYARDEAIMSDEEKLDFQHQFETQQLEFQRLSAEYNQERMQRSNEELENLLSKVQEAVAQISEEEGYEVVLQLGAAIYVADAFNITEQVIEAIDAQN